MNTQYEKPEAPLAALWGYLRSWSSSDGGINGPVIHRGHLKRMFSTHDTAWTQQAVIQGLLHLYSRSGQSYWLDQAITHADAQALRKHGDGHFRWAGHEDDRFSSLVHNCMADVALLDMAKVLFQLGDQRRANLYVEISEHNLQAYVIGKLYREELGGFAMNPVDYYLGSDRFIVNMNSVAIEALGKLDELRATHDHSELISDIGRKILSLQVQQGKLAGSFPYAEWEPAVHLPLYTALALRGYRQLLRVTEDSSWIHSARQVLDFLHRIRCPRSGLWPQKIVRGQVHQYPVFVSGAGMIANGILDASDFTRYPTDVPGLIEPFLTNQYNNGAIRNFIGYTYSTGTQPDTPSSTAWEDVFPTTSWNAQAFDFLSQVLPTPSSFCLPGSQRVRIRVGACIYAENNTTAMILGLWPPKNTVIALYRKKWRYGLVIPGFKMLAMSLRKLLMDFSIVRKVVSRLRYHLRED